MLYKVELVTILNECRSQSKLLTDVSGCSPTSWQQFLTFLRGRRPMNRSSCSFIYTSPCDTHTQIYPTDSFADIMSSLSFTHVCTCNPPPWKPLISIVLCVNTDDSNQYIILIERLIDKGLITYQIYLSDHESIYLQM